MLRDSGLSQCRFGGLAGKDFRVNREAAIRDRAVPDVMVPFAATLKVTANGPSVGEDSTKLLVMQDVETRAVVVGDAVQLQQLWNQGSQFLRQEIG